MEKITLEDKVLDDIFNKGSTSTFLNYDSEINIMKNFLVHNTIKIEGIEFDIWERDSFNIEIRNNSSPIIIKNCVFKKEIVIKGSGSLLIFDNVIFEGELLLEINFKTLKIENCHKHFSLKIKGDIEEEFKIFECDFTKLVLEDCGVSCDAHMERISVLELAKISKSLKKKVHLSEFTCPKLVIAIINKIGYGNETSLAIVNNSQVDLLVFDKRFYSPIKIFDSRISKIDDCGHLFSELIDIQRSVFISTFLYTTQRPEKLSINLSGNIFLDGISFKGEVPIHGSIAIDNCEVSSILFDRFKNTGQFKVTRILKTKKLSILNSSMGKAEVHNCDFSRAIFEFDKSQINEIFISETDFPTRISNNDGFDFGQGKLAYGQLQTVFQKQGDSIRSYEYLAREIESYYHSLRFFSRDFFTKFSLFLNFISNDFGRKWIIGFLFSFIVGFLFFYFLIISTNQYFVAWNFNPRWELTGPFLKFMNPLRHFEAEGLFKDSENLYGRVGLSNWSYIWDFLGRIFVAYGYYQTIQAFRKFGKR